MFFYENFQKMSMQLFQKQPTFLEQFNNRQFTFSPHRRSQSVYLEFLFLNLNNVLRFELSFYLITDDCHLFRANLMYNCDLFM